MSVHIRERYKIGGNLIHHGDRSRHCAVCCMHARSDETHHVKSVSARWDELCARFVMTLFRGRCQDGFEMWLVKWWGGEIR